MRYIPLDVIIFTIFLLPGIFILSSCYEKNRNTPSQDSLSQPSAPNSVGESGRTNQGLEPPCSKAGK